jgi:periplasmic protein TonB
MAQSTLPLAIAGTLAVHLIIAVVVDVASVVGREEKKSNPTKIRLTKINTDNIEPDETPDPEPQPQVAVTKTDTMPRTVRPSPRSRAQQVSKTSTPMPQTEAPPAGGTGPVVRMEGITPAARGVPVPPGGTPRRPGGGGNGSGSGTGSGSGEGSGSGPPVVTSVASIKTPAEAKEGFDYFDARKSYPAEAKRLGIEGKLRVRLVVDAHGKVSQAKLLGTLGHGLDELALSRARAIEFVPAKDSEDRPVASVVVWTFTFTLPKDS